jgi:hypothetical protein
MKGRRTLTSQHVDRYIFCLNYVIERGFAPIVDLVKGIKSELEFNRSYHIDKKTVKRIIDILLSEGLLEVQDVKFTVKYENLELEKKIDIKNERENSDSETNNKSD